jgi:arsenate reductase
MSRKNTLQLETHLIKPRVALEIQVGLNPRWDMKKKVMFLCTGNSCRSQMAEGLARALGGDLIEAYSAGLLPSFVHPMAIEVMNEIGIDISSQTSKGIDERLLNQMDIIITLCGNAEESCPLTPPHIKRMHWPIEDPVSTAKVGEARLDAFRKARDEIKSRILALIQDLKAKA